MPPVGVKVVTRRTLGAYVFLAAPSGTVPKRPKRPKRVTDADYAYKCKPHTLRRDRMADVTEIKIKEGGPAVVSGEFVVIGQDGNPIEDLKPVVAICRCSKSQNQPFCDGSHSKG